MCRLAIYGGFEGKGEAERFRPIARGLDQLERSMGGDGNGYYVAARNTLEKGLFLTTAEIAFDTYRQRGATLFHTRYATVGKASDRLSHPFEAGDWVVAHNGHWHDYIRHNYGEDSDTATAATLVGLYGPGILLDPAFDHSGVWIAASPSEILVMPRGSREFVFQWMKDGSYFHASETIEELRVARRLTSTPDVLYSVDPQSGAVSAANLDPVDIPEDYADICPEGWETYEPTAQDIAAWEDWDKLEYESILRDEKEDDFFRRIATTRWGDA